MNIWRFLLKLNVLQVVVLCSKSTARAQEQGQEVIATPAGDGVSASILEEADADGGEDEANLRPLSPAELVCVVFPWIKPQYCATEIPWF